MNIHKSQIQKISYILAFQLGLSRTSSPKSDNIWIKVLFIKIAMGYGHWNIIEVNM